MRRREQWWKRSGYSHTAWPLNWIFWPTSCRPSSLDERLLQLFLLISQQSVKPCGAFPCSDRVAYIKPKYRLRPFAPRVSVTGVNKPPRFDEHELYFLSGIRLMLGQLLEPHTFRQGSRWTAPSRKSIRELAFEDKRTLHQYGRERAGTQNHPEFLIELLNW